MPKRIAVYHGDKNISGDDVAAALKKLSIPFGMVAKADVLNGGLMSFAGVVFPGGHSVRIGTRGNREVARYVEAGGGFIGICAGCQFGASIEILPVTHKIPRAVGTFDMRVVRRHPITRGYDTAGRTTNRARWTYSPKGRVRIRHCNGGILKAEPGAKVLVSFDEAGEDGAIVVGERGKGRVVLISPHPESTPAPEDEREKDLQDPLPLLGNAVHYVTGR